MAGRIALGIVAAVLLVFFGYAAGKFEQRDAMIPFKVVQVAKEIEPERVSISGLKTPFTVLVHETRINTTLPGEFGQIGDIVYLPDPRHSSSSTIGP